MLSATSLAVSSRGELQKQNSVVLHLVDQCKLWENCIRTLHFAGTYCLRYVWHYGHIVTHVASFLPSSTLYLLNTMGKSISLYALRVPSEQQDAMRFYKTHTGCPLTTKCCLCVWEFSFLKDQKWNKSQCVERVDRNTTVQLWGL